MRLAFVGFGRIAPSHLQAFRALGCEFVGVAARSAATLERARRDAGIANGYTSVAELVREQNPDGIVCAPAIDANFEVARSLLPLGVPTLLEKPPGKSVAEVGELADLAKRYDTPVQVAFNRLHYASLRAAIAHAGGLERISHVSVEWSEDPQHLASRGFSSQQIAERSCTNSIHGLSLLTYLAGALPAPQLACVTLPGAFRWLMSLQGRSDRGVLAQFTSNWDAQVPWRLTFSVPEARYVFSPLEACSVQRRGSSEALALDATEADFKPGFLSQARTFLGVIRERNVPSFVTLQAALAPLNLAEALTRACLSEASAK